MMRPQKAIFRLVLLMSLQVKCAHLLDMRRKSARGLHSGSSTFGKAIASKSSKGAASLSDYGFHDLSAKSMSSSSKGYISAPPTILPSIQSPSISPWTSESLLVVSTAVQLSHRRAASSDTIFYPEALATTATGAAPALVPNEPSRGFNVADTEYNAVAFKTMAFSIEYAGVQSAPTTNDFAAAAQSTLEHLELFLRDEISLYSPLATASMEGRPVAYSTNLASIVFEVSITIDDDPQHYMMAEMDALLRLGFSRWNDDNLLQRLQSLPAINPFAMTDAIYFVDLNGSSLSSLDATIWTNMDSITDVSAMTVIYKEASSVNLPGLAPCQSSKSTKGIKGLKAHKSHGSKGKGLLSSKSPKTADPYASMPSTSPSPAQYPAPSANAATEGPASQSAPSTMLLTQEPTAAANTPSTSDMPLSPIAPGSAPTISPMDSKAPSSIVLPTNAFTPIPSLPLISRPSAGESTSAPSLFPKQGSSVPTVKAMIQPSISQAPFIMNPTQTAPSSAPSLTYSPTPAVAAAPTSSPPSLQPLTGTILPQPTTETGDTELPSNMSQTGSPMSNKPASRVPSASISPTVPLSASPTLSTTFGPPSSTASKLPASGAPASSFESPSAGLSPSLQPQPTMSRSPEQTASPIPENSQPPSMNNNLTSQPSMRLSSSALPTMPSTATVTLAPTFGGTSRTPSNSLSESPMFVRAPTDGPSFTSKPTTSKSPNLLTQPSISPRPTLTAFPGTDNSLAPSTGKSQTAEPSPSVATTTSPSLALPTTPAIAAPTLTSVPTADQSPFFPEDPVLSVTPTSTPTANTVSSAPTNPRPAFQPQPSVSLQPTNVNSPETAMTQLPSSISVASSLPTPAVAASEVPSEVISPTVSSILPPSSIPSAAPAGGEGSRAPSSPTVISPSVRPSLTPTSQTMGPGNTPSSSQVPIVSLLPTTAPTIRLSPTRQPQPSISPRPSATKRPRTEVTSIPTLVDSATQSPASTFPTVTSIPSSSTTVVPASGEITEVPTLSVVALPSISPLPETIAPSPAGTDAPSTSVLNAPSGTSRPTVRKRSAIPSQQPQRYVSKQPVSTTPASETTSLPTATVTDTVVPTFSESESNVPSVIKTPTFASPVIPTSGDVRPTSAQVTPAPASRISSVPSALPTTESPGPSLSNVLQPSLSARPNSIEPTVIGIGVPSTGATSTPAVATEPTGVPTTAIEAPSRLVRPSLQPEPPIMNGQTFAPATESPFSPSVGQPPTSVPTPSESVLPTDPAIPILPSRMPSSLSPNAIAPDRPNEIPSPPTSGESTIVPSLSNQGSANPSAGPPPAVDIPSSPVTVPSLQPQSSVSQQPSSIVPVAEGTPLPNLSTGQPTSREPLSTNEPTLSLATPTTKASPTRPADNPPVSTFLPSATRPSAQTESPTLILKAAPTKMPSLAPFEPTRTETSQPASDLQPTAAPQPSPVLQSIAPVIRSPAPVILIPTQSPIMATPSPATASPTERTDLAPTSSPSSRGSSISVQPMPSITGLISSGPFSVVYSVSDVPDQASRDAAADTTCSYLEQYLRDYFSLNVDVTLSSVTCSPTSDTFDDPSQIGYTVVAEFDTAAATSRPPGDLELNLLIQSAFLMPASDQLIADLQILPAENPFSSTTAVLYQGVVVLQSLELQLSSDQSPSWLWPFTCIIALTGGIVSYFAAIAFVNHFDS